MCVHLQLIIKIRVFLKYETPRVQKFYKIKAALID